MSKSDLRFGEARSCCTLGNRHRPGYLADSRCVASDDAWTALAFAGGLRASATARGLLIEHDVTAMRAGFLEEAMGTLPHEAGRIARKSISPFGEVE
jgi:hypothetical protein